MEGKGLLFKVFADIDVFDIEINEKDTEKLIEVITKISPTFEVSIWGISKRQNVLKSSHGLRICLIYRFSMMISMELL
jgi:hypothetical protein